MEGGEIKLIVHLCHKFYFEVHFESQSRNILQNNVDQIVSGAMLSTKWHTKCHLIFIIFTPDKRARHQRTLKY